MLSSIAALAQGDNLLVYWLLQRMPTAVLGSFALDGLAIGVIALGILLIDLHDVAAKPLAKCFADYTAETDLPRVVFLDKSYDLFLEFAMLRLVVD